MTHQHENVILATDCWRKCVAYGPDRQLGGKRITELQQNSGVCRHNSYHTFIKKLIL